jgi:cold shock CspA family protein
MTGIVRTYRSDRGYGWLQPLIGKPISTSDIFFHVRSCVDGMAPPFGAEVSFDLVRGPAGRPQAANVRLVKLSGTALLKRETGPPLSRQPE